MLLHYPGLSHELLQFDLEKEATRALQKQTQPRHWVSTVSTPASRQLHAGRDGSVAVPPLEPFTVHTKGSLKCLCSSDQVKPRTCMSDRNGRNSPLGQTSAVASRIFH